MGAHHMTQLSELATERQQVIDSFETSYDEDTDLKIMEMLYAVEAQIETATFATDAEKLAGLMILFEMNDAPVFADQFKAKLFSRI
jgi:hypothetical protein